MANLIQYSTVTPTKFPALRKGNTVLTTGNSNEFRLGNFFNGVDIPIGGYVVYALGIGNNPKVWVANNGSELILIAKTLGSGDVNEAGAKYYLCSLADVWLLNNSPDNIVTNNLSLYLDAGDLSSYPGSNVDIMDLSGGGENGNLINGPGWVERDGAIQFDGADDRIQTSYAPQFNDFTVCLIFKDNGSGAWGRIVDKGYQTGFFISSYFATSGYPYVGCGIIEPSPPHGIALPYDNSRYHFFTSVRQDDQHTIYLDGIEQTNSKTVSPEPLNAQTIAFGSWNNSTSQPFRGNLAKVLIYDAALSPTQILQNYYGGPIVTDRLIRALDFSNLVCYEPQAVSGVELTGRDTYNVNNSPTYLSDFGGGILCDETDEFINLNDVCATDFVTVECWYTRAAAGNGEDIVFNKESTWEVKDNGGDLMWAVMASNQGWFWYDTGANMAVGETAQIVLSYDGNRVKFYKNGKLIQTYNYPSGGILANQNSSIPKLNARGSGSNFNFGVHTFYQFRVYDRALSDEEVGINYNAQRLKFE